MSTHISPIGTSVADDNEDWLEDPEYRAEHERLASVEALARIVIMRRATLGITQAELAKRMNTTASVVSRIETGQRTISVHMLQRLAEALEARAAARLPVRL
jgi:ribosome-binding protein aMBF1 (putative translation factor)